MHGKNVKIAENHPETIEARKVFEQKYSWLRKISEISHQSRFCLQYTLFSRCNLIRVYCNPTQIKSYLSFHLGLSIPPEETATILPEHNGPTDCCFSFVLIALSSFLIEKQSQNFLASVFCVRQVECVHDKRIVCFIRSNQFLWDTKRENWDENQKR